MIVACYTMDLYCDSCDWNKLPHIYGEFPHQFTGETYSQCKQQALARGWVFKSDGTHICPKHSGKKANER